MAVDWCERSCVAGEKVEVGWGMSGIAPCVTQGTRSGEVEEELW